MGQASLSANAPESATGPPLFRIPEQAIDPSNPIKKVDEAVRAVLAELKPKGPSRSRKESVCQVVVDRLFSLRHAEALTPGTRIVQLGPSTVVTPLARDLLKQKGITIRLDGPRESLASPCGEWAVSIAADSELLGTVKALRRALLEEPRAWIEFEPSLDFLTNWLAEGKGRGAMFITSEAALAVWQSCQVTGVRAASTAEPAEVHRAVQSLGMNLLVVEPAGKSISWIKQLAGAFRASGAPRAPEFLHLEDRR
jgi:hypothetical protein